MVPAKFKKAYDVPKVTGVGKVVFSLDGGGREILIDVLREKSVKTMIEIGSFLGGSAMQWLNACPDLQVIGVDPWEGNWASHLSRYKDNPIFESCWKDVDDRDAAIEALQKHGPYNVSMANMQDYKGRFFAYKGKSPEALKDLHSLGVEPELIYFDSDKILGDLQVALEVYPDAILSGDDWRWGADQGYPVQTAVKAFCKAHGFDVEDRRATWVIHK